jgi:hypothetical protein
VCSLGVRCLCEWFAELGTLGVEPLETELVYNDDEWYT